MPRWNIICFSTADWDTLLPTNKHQLMRRFAARGSRVLYVETLGTRAPKMGSGTDLLRIGRRLARGFEGARKREKRLWTISPVVRPAWRTSPQIALNRAAFAAQAASTLRRFPDPIAWIYSPYACHLLETIRPALTVYHLVDDLSAVPGADREALLEAEARMLARADLVFCTERSLYDRARRVSDQAHFMPNVADYTHFSNATARRESTALVRLRALKRPRILFSGNLAPHKVDFALFRELASRRPDWEFVLIGPAWEGAASDRDWSALKERDNVLFTGHVPYEDLPPFLHEADVLLIPYRQNEATRAVFPLKLFEYLATGRPVVASPLPSLLPYAGAIRLAESAPEWIAAIGESLRDSHEMESQRRALARRHTWDRRVVEMETLVGEALEKR